MAEGGRRHREQAQRLPSGKWEAWAENYRVIPGEELYTVPAPLIQEILTSINE